MGCEKCRCKDCKREYKPLTTKEQKIEEEYHKKKEELRQLLRVCLMYTILVFSIGILAIMVYGLKKGLFIGAIIWLAALIFMPKDV